MSEGSERRPVILASDGERERAIAVLREAVGEGRLTLEEFSGRVGLVLEARTDEALAELVRDLPSAPAPPIPQNAAVQHRALCSHVARTGTWSLPSRSSWRAIFGT